ncbi:MFS general substrate transporter [Cristinia sonorae]|uniref:MFS general substrate transporter n=1 Tax=Cristinia sonorae TaxID=1940300 RepID=A0A8K0XQW4_9AGAR|nr:MFS general substrate transporter [Cristinia sonorae]
MIGQTGEPVTDTADVTISTTETLNRRNIITQEKGEREGVENVDERPKRGFRFWLLFVALCCSILLTALDLGGVGNATPTIVHDLHGTDFTWVGSAYALASASCLPLSGNLADIFGRRPVLLASLLIFAIGSAVAASAHSMMILIGGRAIQGVGGGGIQALVSIIVADISTLRDRGIFNGIVGMMWTLGSVLGPFVNGSLAEKASWRWIFYLNLPLCGIACGVVVLFLNLPTPQGHFWKKLSQIDWLGNIIIIASTTSCMLALTWGGIRLPWASAQVLVPLVLGVVGLGVSLFYEFKYPIKPTVRNPIPDCSTQHAELGFVSADSKVCFLQQNQLLRASRDVSARYRHQRHCILLVSRAAHRQDQSHTDVIRPMWFQAARAASPILAGVFVLPLAATISPFAIVQGIIAAKTGTYRSVSAVGWCFLVLGVGLFISVRLSTSIGLLVLYQLFEGVGMGLVYSTTFMVLAPLPVSENAAAVALLTFFRTFSQTWGIAIAGTILQNELTKKLPAQLIAQLPSGSDLAYSIIPQIRSLPEPLKGETQDAFLQSTRLVWIILSAISGVGLLTVFATEHIPLHRKTDSNWDMKEQTKTVTSRPGPEPTQASS